MNDDSRWSCVRGCKGENRSFSVRDGKDRRPLRVTFCLTCGLLQQSVLPSIEGLRQYYSHHYRREYKGTASPKPKHIYRAAIAASNRLSWMARVLQNGDELGRPTSAIDIGAGGGEFVFLAGRQGLNAIGIEPNLGYSEFARAAYGANVITTELDQLDDYRADLVTLFHVLEHMPNPTEVMKKLFRLVNDGGWLYVEVPNIEQADAAPSNIFFRAHLFYFSAASLVSIASPYFKPVSIDSSGNLRIIFRRRASEVQGALPSADSVRQTLKRLEQKGWLEYLFRGGGFFKQTRRIGQYWRESRLTGMTAAAIVELASRRILDSDDSL